LNQNHEPILKPIKFWKLPPLKAPDFIEAETLLKTQTLICKTQNANLKTNLILETALRLECKFLPTACVTRVWAGVDKA
jgi:hypothetical protein